MIRIMVADDHAVVRHGLTQILEKNRDMKIVAEHKNGVDALNWLLNHDCDIALIDISMPGMNGIDLLRQLQKVKPKLPVLIISAYPEDQYAVRLIKTGAAGYLNKECAPEEVMNAVHCILDGKRYISPAVAEMLANELSIPAGKLPHETLSNREYQIFLLLASAKTVAEIADTLKLSVKTISTYRSRVLEKMSLHNNAELMRYAVDRHLM
ncbi:MAG: response regulator transcription factor [Betaproteobacteria bacterium]|nr:response regulator transcription factor [Betaproteobacteria bacterium]MDE2309441.1 response regulator transcription factor [Betaproteobacteria bacterium]